MITEGMIRRGLAKGVVSIIDSPLDDGAVCQIGDHWFYCFNFCDESEEMSAAQMRAEYTEDEIAHEIWSALELMKRELMFYVELDYYETVLKKAGIGG